MTESTVDMPPLGWFRRLARRKLGTWTSATKIVALAACIPLATFLPEWFIGYADRYSGGSHAAELAVDPLVVALRTLNYLLAVLLPLVGLPILFTRANRLAEHLARTWEPDR